MRRLLAELKAIDMEKNLVYEKQYERELLEGVMTYADVRAVRVAAEEEERRVAAEKAEEVRVSEGERGESVCM